MAQWGLRKLLNWIKNTYQPNPPFYITESGCSDGANRGLQGHFDAARVMSFHDYLSEMSKAITAQFFRRMNLKVSSYCLQFPSPLKEYSPLAIAAFRSPVSCRRR